MRFAIEEKIGHYNLKFLTECFYTCLEEKEMYMLRYVIKGFKVGAKIKDVLTDNDVNILSKAHRHLERESHHFLGFVRFYRAGDVYVSKIEPKNSILPLIASHFAQRFANQQFMIYDAVHKQALISVNGNNFLLPRGKTSTVPYYIAEEYRRSLKAQAIMDEHIDSMLGASK